MKEQLKILLLAGNTLRARAYAQSLSSVKDVTINGLFFGFDTRNCSSPVIDPITQNYFNKESIFIPDLTIPLEETFKSNGWKYSKVVTEDVNSKEVLIELAKYNANIIVFAGYGGQILKTGHFQSSANYLHMHPGNLPSERGSTTIYYSILNKKKCTVTAFYMTEKIDLGVNVLRKQFSIPTKGVDIDLFYDNIIRADCFVSAIEEIKKQRSIGLSIEDESEEFYVIHPVLKHIAKLSLS